MGKHKDQQGDQSRQLILDKIRWYLNQNGVYPTFRDIEDMTGLPVSSVYYHAQILRKEGRLTWKEGKARTLRILP